MASEKAKAIKARLKAKFFLTGETIRFRLLRGTGLVLLARYCMLPFSLWLYRIWQNWLYSSANPDIWLRPYMGVTTVVFFCFLYGVLLNAPAMIDLFKKNFVTDYDAMSGVAELVGGIGGLVLPVGFLGVILPCAIHRRRGIAAVAAAVTGMAATINLILLLSIVCPLPISLPLWLVAVAFFSVPIFAFIAIFAVEDDAPMHFGKIIPVLLLSLLATIAAIYRNSLDVPQPDASSLPLVWQQDLDITLKVADAMTTDAAIWYQMVNRRPGDLRPLRQSENPNPGPFDFHIQMRMERNFVAKYMDEVIRIFPIANMTPEDKVAHFAQRQWMGRYNATPTADSLTSGLVIIFYHNSDIE